MSERITLGIICGGKSGEHAVSLNSAYNIRCELSLERYDVYVIALNREHGAWQVGRPSEILRDAQLVQSAHLPDSYFTEEVFLQRGGAIRSKGGELRAKIDVFFPITHGRFGEDGVLQGCLEMAEVPYVGSDVTGSAIAMDKDVTKRLLQSAGLPVVPFLCLRKNRPIAFEEVSEQLGSSLFVKPAREGSSIGVSHVTNQEELDVALKKAFALGKKVLLEQAMVAREIECAVLGNENPEAASVLGEIIPNEGFYSYAAKYRSSTGAKLRAPARLEESLILEIRNAATQAFQITECSGMARVDFFVTSDGKFMINEINTLPGFTKISMYPVLWRESGLPYTELLDRLIELALEKHAGNKKP